MVDTQYLGKMPSPKYNRTFHMPWSPGATNDDKISKDLGSLIGNEIVITEKMDGSNTSLEYNGCFARTHSGPPTHVSFDALKAKHACIKQKIPEGVQLFGEWCFALHSIEYQELPGYFLMFNVRDIGKQKWASWDEVTMWAEEVEVPTVPVLFKGTISYKEELQELVESFMNQPSNCGGLREGVVARIVQEFSDESFDKCVLKCVRSNHVQTTEHWKDLELIKNKLRI